MDQESVDRNILFGIMAAQRGLITPQQMQEAFRAWIDDKSQSMDTVMRESGLLTDDLDPDVHARFALPQRHYVNDRLRLLVA